MPKTWLAERISGSIWMFPAIETIHILAMAIMFGGMLVLNIKLLGLGFPHQPLTLLSKTLQKFVNWGIWIMLATGYMMFCSEAMKCFSNDGFKFKMAFLAAALIFQWTVYRKAVATDTPIKDLGYIAEDTSARWLIGRVIALSAASAALSAS